MRPRLPRHIVVAKAETGAAVEMNVFVGFDTGAALAFKKYCSSALMRLAITHQYRVRCFKADVSLP